MSMGFWTFYVAPLCVAIMLVLIGSQFMLHKVKLVSYLLYFLAGIGYVIAAIFAVFYIYVAILELVTPDSLSHWGWIMFWNDNLAFLAVTVVLLLINIVVLRHGRKVRLQVR